MYKKLIFTGLIMSSLLVGCSDKNVVETTENESVDKREEIIDMLSNKRMTPEKYKELVTDDLKLVKLDSTKKEILTGDLEILFTGFSVKQSEVSGFNLEIPTESKNNTDKTYTVKLSNFENEAIDLSKYIESEYVYEILPKQEKISSLSLDFLDFVNDAPKPKGNLLFTISVFENGSEKPLIVQDMDLVLDISKEDKENAKKITENNKLLEAELEKYNKENAEVEEPTEKVEETKE